MSKPEPRLCSQCGRTLQPQQIAENSYVFGHSCPTIIKRLNEEAERIRGNGYSDQNTVRRALESLQYQNTWTK